MPWPDPHGLGLRAPAPLPRHPPFSDALGPSQSEINCWGFRCFRRDIPGWRWGREGQSSLSPNRGDLVWSLLGSEANGCLSPVLTTVKQRRSPFPETDRQTGPCSLVFSVPDSLSLFLSQSLQVFKGETPPFFSSASSLCFCSSHCKSKNPNLSAHSFLLYCRGEGFNPLLTARALASPCAVCAENAPACFSNSSSKVLTVLCGSLMILCHPV